MSRKSASSRHWLTALVLIHLAVSIVHGWAHVQAKVALSQAGSLFVFIVILIGPLVGLALTWPAGRIGNWIIAITLSGSFLFGLLNHFVYSGQDHVAHVASQWRTLFATTAVLLAGIELLGSSLAIGFAWNRNSVS